MPAQRLKVRVIHPDRVMFEGEADFVMAPGTKGSLGIFPTHTPLYAELVAGEVHIQGDKEETFALEGGIIKVRNDEVTILLGL